MSGQRDDSTNRSRGCSENGFSLIELLIVVAVILIITAIAIPNFIRSKMMANEAAAVQNLRNISTAEVVYSTTYGIGFSPTLAAVGGNSVIVDQNNAGLIDSVLSTGVKSGYTFTYTVVSQDSQGHVTNYTVTSDPLTSNSGTRHFFIDQTAVIRANYTATATASDPPIQ